MTPPSMSASILVYSSSSLEHSSSPSSGRCTPRLVDSDPRTLPAFSRGFQSRLLTVTGSGNFRSGSGLPCSARRKVIGMRATLLLLTILVAAAVPAAAQPVFSKDHPRPTVGIGVGVSDDGNWSGDGKNLLLSGTYELPFGDWARVRLEAARTRQAIPALVYRADGGDTARFTRLTLSLAGVKRSLAPIAPYGGLGIGLYRATFDRAPASSWRAAPYVHGGIEVQASDTIAIDGEIGVHAIGGHFYPESGLLGEALLRIKIGL